MRLLHWMAAAALAVMPLKAAESLADDCAFRPVAGADVKSMEPEFRRQFCLDSQSAQCDQRWHNASDLLGRLAADSRVPNIATASYIAATAYIETGIKNFDPGAVETIGREQRERSYYADGFYGRGWVQLTHRDKYKTLGDKLGIDLVSAPERAREPDTSYEILFVSMTEGMVETYRSTVDGGAGKAPIKLGDFITSSAADYDLARAVINANCVGPRPCNRMQRGDRMFIPDAAHLDASAAAAKAARRFEKMYCKAVAP